MAGGVAVFVGPSAPVSAIRAVLPQAAVLPPAQREDIYRVREQGAELILMIDGVFGQLLAPSPREIVDVLGDGATIVGASSLGAVRAVECGVAGMIGAGLVHRLFTSGVLGSDDEVAVTALPDRDYRAASVALVDVRYAMSLAARRGVLSRPAAMDIVERCVATYFPDRHWRSLVDDPQLRAWCEARSLKRHDALRAARQVRAMHEVGTEDRAGVRLPLMPFPRPMRYPGHDPLLSRTRAQLETLLFAWLTRQNRLPDLVGPAMGPAEVWDALVESGELPTELLRWYAASDGASHRK